MSPSRFYQRVGHVQRNLEYLLSRRIQAYYIGCLNINNLGDQALFMAIQDIFRHEIIFATEGISKKLTKVLGGRDATRGVFLGGGTLIKKSERYLQRMKDLQHQYPEAKSIVFGTGVADIDLWNQFGVKTDVSGWCSTLELTDYVGVRGPLSKKHLEQWGLKHEINIIGDPAIWFARNKIAPKTRQKRIGINFGSTSNQLFGHDDDLVFQFAVRLLRMLEMENWKITFFPVIKSDITFMEKAIEVAGISSPVINKDYLNLALTLSKLEKQDVFIGEKLHSVVLACCVYTPAIMLEYRTKCRDFMMAINRQGWNFRTDALDPDVIFEAAGKLYTDIEQHQNELFSKLQQQRLVLQGAARSVMTILRNEHN